MRRRRRWLRDIHRRCWQRDICRRRRSCSNTYKVMKKNPIIFWKPIIPFFGGSKRIRSRSFHAMGTSVYQYDCRTYRQWNIDVCPTVCSQHQTHDDSQARTDLMVLWWISDVVWNRKRDIISTRLSKRKAFHHFGRSHGRNGSKGGFTVYEKESPQKHQRHVHRSESVSSRKPP